MLKNKGTLIMEWENEDITRKMQYILNMRPVLNKDAFFSDGTRYYRNPTEPKAGETGNDQFPDPEKQCRRSIP